jgi:hypothetical protein
MLQTIAEDNDMRDIIGYYDGTIYSGGKAFTNVVFYIDSDREVMVCDCDRPDEADANDKLYTFINGNVGLSPEDPTTDNVHDDTQNINNKIVEKLNEVLNRNIE